MAIQTTTVPYRVPGRLIYNPTAGALGTYPFGDGSTTGLYLGLVAGPIEYEFMMETVEDRFRQDRGHVFDVAVKRLEVRMRATLKQEDATTLARIFPGGLMTTGGSGNPYMRWPGSLVVGAYLSAYAGKILFVPEDQTNHDFILMRKAIRTRCEPVVFGDDEESARGYQMEFLALPDTSAASAIQMLERGRKADITI